MTTTIENSAVIAQIESECVNAIRLPAFPHLRLERAYSAIDSPAARIMLETLSDVKHAKPISFKKWKDSGRGKTQKQDQRLRVDLESEEKAEREKRVLSYVNGRLYDLSEEEMTQVLQRIESAHETFGKFLELLADAPDVP